MRTIPTGLDAHLKTGATTLCFCWRLTRKDSSVSGFTDHDRDLNFDGTLFRANSGFDGAQAESHLGLAVGGTEISGLLEAPALSEFDLANGLYDNARVEIWRVNRNELDDRVLLDVATIGEVRRSPYAFAAELRGLAHLFDQERGRLYQSSCYADLGDQHCGIDTSNPLYQTDATIIEILEQLIVTVNVSGFDSHWFSGGRIEFLDGENVGAWQTIESHHALQSSAIVRLWRPFCRDGFGRSAGANNRWV